MKNAWATMAFLIVVVTQPGQAQVLPSFSAKDYLDQYSTKITAGLGKKIQELIGTYIPRARGNTSTGGGETLAFFSKDSDVCDKKEFTGQVASINFRTQRTKESLYQTLYYSGCEQGQYQFMETILTQGDSLAALTESEIKSGQRTLTLRKGETYRKYSLLDENKIELFSFTTSIVQPEGWKTVILLFGTPLASLSSRTSPAGELIEIIKFPVSISASYSKGSVNFTDNSEVRYQVDYFQNVQRFWDGGTREQMTYPSFIQTLDLVFSQLYLNIAFKQFFNSFLSNGFPQSKLAPQNNKLKDELNFLRNLLYSNPSDPNNGQRTLEYVNRWMRAIEDGEITDLRPQ